ncbi:hypothetical protein H0G86_011089 [Trichoderma simmonsii]|uniref:Uncharacterized protein n=1 Tax=Trichoderma simmonsii TaxID=1491479 RepID=A0A8G0PIW6_9HYPO|nr:hypothetical protein H0G86_011089 [Trichoderma simmonsii]
MTGLDWHWHWNLQKTSVVLFSATLHSDASPPVLETDLNLCTPQRRSVLTAVVPCLAYLPLEPPFGLIRHPSFTSIHIHILCSTPPAFRTRLGFFSVSSSPFSSLFSLSETTYRHYFKFSALLL